MSTVKHRRSSSDSSDELSLKASPRPTHKAPSTGLSKPRGGGFVTRSMSKIRDPRDISRFEGLIKEGTTALGGIRRKRAPLMDALVNIADEENDRPKKVARYSMPAATKSARRPSHHAGPVEQRAPGTPVQLRMLVEPNSGRSLHSDSSSEDSLLLKPTPRKTVTETPKKFEGDEIVGRRLFMGNTEMQPLKKTQEHRPRVLGTHRPTSSVSSIPRKPTTSSFAAPTRASLLKQSKTTQQLSASSKQMQQPMTTERSSNTASSSMMAPPRKKPTVAAPFSFSAPRSNSVRTESNGKSAEIRDLASIVETTGIEDVEMVDASAVTAQRTSHLTDRERLAIRQRTTLGVSSQAPFSRPSSSISRLPLPISHAPLAKSSAPPSLPTARKPSYPAGLGSGPLAKPVSRVVSNPIVQRQSDRIDGIETFSQRSVSDPLGSSTLSTSRSQRVGLNTNSETSKSLHGLSAALAKLQVKKTQADAAAAAHAAAMSQQRPIDGSAGGWSFAGPTLVTPDTPGKWLTAARANKVSAPPPSIASRDLFGLSQDRHEVRQSVGGNNVHVVTQPKPLAHARQSMGGRVEGGATFGKSSNLSRTSAGGSFASLMESSAGEGCLRGVTAFVDVRTSEGDDSSGAFADMLRSCGARVLQRPSESCTHILYKSGKPSTLQWLYKQEAEDRPFVVGVNWIAKCKETGCKVDEKPYLVAIQDEAVFQRRRKSMEPKQLAAMMSSGGNTIHPNGLASITQARRISMQFAPRIGSPLKKAYRPSISAAPMDSEEE